MPKQIERIYPLRKTTSHKLQRQKAERAAIRERIEAFDAAMKGEVPGPARSRIALTVVKDAPGGDVTVTMEPSPSSGETAAADVIGALVEAAVTVARKEKANRTALVCLVNKTLSDAWTRTSK